MVKFWAVSVTNFLVNVILKPLIIVDWLTVSERHLVTKMAQIVTIFNKNYQKNRSNA